MGPSQNAEGGEVAIVAAAADSGQEQEQEQDLTYLRYLGT